MTYQELKAQQQKEFNSFPMECAFSDEWFKQIMTVWGFKEDETDKICSIGYGSFIRKSDKEAFKEMTDKFDKEMEDFLSSMNNFENAVFYEMCNHEYGINYQGAYDVLNALGFDCKYEHEFDCLNEEQVAAYRRAVAHYYKEANGNEWF